MNISNFFNSYAGMYIAQAFCHSFVAALIVDRAIQAWRISDPVIQQRFSLIVMLFPIVSFPIYQVINPDRGSVTFRLDALFDMNRWLNLEIWGKVPLNLLFMALLLITSLVFFFQELIPIVRHAIESRTAAQEENEEDFDAHPLIDRALENLLGQKPRVAVIEDDEYILFSTTSKAPTIYVSSGLVGVSEPDQLEAAIAHEMAHIERNKRLMLVLVYIFRILMFFNPVVLIEFRRIVQEEEKVCDDIAVSMTQKPRALAEILKKFLTAGGAFDMEKVKKLPALGSSLKEYSHNVHIESRISRLEQGHVQGPGGEWLKFSLTLAAVTGINYFVV